MKILLVFGLFCHFILASHLDDQSNTKKKEVETNLASLPDGPVYEIFNHLHRQDQERFAATSKEYFKFDPREVVLNLPMQGSKEPTPFVCNHLKMRKKLVINLKKDIDEKLFARESLIRKYLNCLSGIESLRFGWFDGIHYLSFVKFKYEAMALTDPNFQIQEFFPKLRHLSLNLDVIHEKDDRFSLLQTTLKERIAQMTQLETLSLKIIDYIEEGSTLFSPMISELKKLPNFKRLSIEFKGHLYAITDILAQTKHANYNLDLTSEAYRCPNIGRFMENLPKKTETLDLFFYEITDTEQFCTPLSTLSLLKNLKLRTSNEINNFNCLMNSLPHSLAGVSILPVLKTSHGVEINLPKSLESANFREVNSEVFEALANQVRVLKTTISDPENLLNIGNPFTQVKSLSLRNEYYTMPLESWLKLLELLPTDMDLVYFSAKLRTDADYNTFEEKLLSLGKRIKQFTMAAAVFPGYIERQYIFDGTKMTKKE